MTATIDTRTHVMGDMLMITGTFDTDGSVSYDGLLGQVFAASGHLEDTTFSTGIAIDNPGGHAAGSNSITVGSVDARLYFSKGEDIYVNGARVATITRVASATSILLESPGLVTAVADRDILGKFGPQQGAVTLENGDFHVGIDTVAKRVQFTHGNAVSTQADADYKGRFWILGSRA